MSTINTTDDGGIRGATAADCDRLIDLIQADHNRRLRLQEAAQVEADRLGYGSWYAARRAEYPFMDAPVLAQLALTDRALAEAQEAALAARMRIRGY